MRWALLALAVSAATALGATQTVIARLQPAVKIEHDGGVQSVGAVQVQSTDAGVLITPAEA